MPLVRGAAAHYELDLAFVERSVYVLQALQHERVVPQISLRVALRESEDDEESLFEIVRTLHGVL